jgi:hypothetical protein
MSDSDKENDQHLNMLNDEIKHHKKMKRKEYNHKYYREKKKRNQNQSISFENINNHNFIHENNDEVNNRVLFENINTESINANSDHTLDPGLDINLSNEILSESSESILNSLNSSINESTDSEDFINEKFTYLFEGSNVKLKDFSLALLGLKFKHKFSEAALDDIINLVKILLPSPNILPKTSKTLINSLEIDVPSKTYIVCTECKNLNIKNINMSKHKMCSVCGLGELVEFATYDLSYQIETIIKNKSYLNQIKDANKVRNSEGIQNALDGLIYKSVEKNKNYLNFSLNINTDGAPMIESRNFSIWPVLATVVELNQSCREKFTNIIVLGVWLHSSKPTNDIFFEKAQEEVEKLSKSVINILDIKLKIRSHSGGLDLPAKAALTNTKQFNGEFGCIACFHPGKRLGRVNTYPFNKHYPQKTNNDYLHYSELADEKNKDIDDESKHISIFGYFGKAPINRILKIPEQIPFDYLHLVLQGHVKWLLRHIFINDEIFEPKKQGENMYNINKILDKIKLPHYFNRKPYNIQNSSKWKSSEIKIFLFYESIPAFIKDFPSWYFYRFASYVIAIRLLYEPIKDIQVLTDAQSIIETYIKSLDDTFPPNCYTYTIHAHLHLAEQVRLHGPLQCHSLFCFEGSLFHLKNLPHGTVGFINQITNHIFLFKSLPNLLKKTPSENNNLNAFISKKFNVNINDKNNSLIGGLLRNLNNEESYLLKFNFNINNKDALISERFQMNNKILHSKSYKRKGNSNSYSISYLLDNELKYADIEYFLEIDNKYYAFITRHTLINNYILPESTGFFYDMAKKYFSYFFKAIRYSNNIDIIECESILNRCIIIENKDDIFLTELKYEFEHD